MTARHLRTRLASLFRRDRLETELDAELQYHIDMLIEQNIAAGMPPDEARRGALTTFGAVQGIKDDVRDTWLSRFFETAVAGHPLRRAQPAPQPRLRLRRDADDGARHRREHRDLQRRQRRAAAAAALPATATSSSCCVTGSGDTVANDLGFSVKDLTDYRQSRSLSDVVEFHNMFFTLLSRHEAERVSTGVVSANFFDVLGVKPIYGRTFVDGDDAHGAPAVLVLSHKYWQRSFGGDPNIVGQVFRMNDRPHTVVGVLPPVPQYPLDVDVYMPTSACPFRSRQQADRQPPGAHGHGARPRSGPRWR